MRIFTILFFLTIASAALSSQAAEERHYMMNGEGEFVTLIGNAESRLARLFMGKLNLAGYTEISNPPKDTPSGVQCEILIDRVTFQISCSTSIPNGKEKVLQGVYCIERRSSMVGIYLDTMRKTVQQ